MMIGIFKFLLSFATLAAHVYLTESGPVNVLNYNNHLPTSDHNASVPECHYTWQFFNTSSKKCECGSDIHGAILCNDTTNDIRLLGCHCMALNTNTGQFETGKCFIGCTGSFRTLSHKDRVYNLVPKDPSKLNEWMCMSLNMNGTMCGNCLPGCSRRVYSYDLSCHRCSSS